jgi:response regulator RpfG family c-di-GMP phosphodiesterase
MTQQETTLKLELPDIFGFSDDPTKAKMPPRKIWLSTHSDHEASADQIRGVIVLVESDDEVCRLIARLLDYEGYTVLKTSCLAEARILLRETTANLLLARRSCIPKNLESELVLHELEAKTTIRVVDNYSELMLGQVVDYDSMSQSHVASLDLLVSLLESQNDNARGHAHNVAKYSRLIGQRMGLTRRQLDGLTMAAYLHDLAPLVTSRQIGQVIGADGQLQLPTYDQTADMLASIPFAHEVSKLLAVASTTTETGKEDNQGTTAQPPLSARILRAADFYDSIRRQSGGEANDVDELFTWMRNQAADVFDPDVLDVFINIRKKEIAINSMNLFSATVLMVDPRPEELQPLQLRLEHDDCRVLTAKSPADAIDILRNEPVTVVISEYKFDNENGFILLQQMKNDPRLRHIPLVFHAGADTNRIKQALELGAEDWFAKPHNIEILAIKLQRIIERQTENPNRNSDGVQGNVRDLGVIELVQVLSSSNRSVVISIDRGQHKGELYMQNGKVVHAALAELTGDLAAVEILLWDDGRFHISPLKSAPMTTVTMSTDSLVLETCLQKDLRTHHARAAS